MPRHEVEEVPDCKTFKVGGFTPVRTTEAASHTDLVRESHSDGRVGAGE